MHFFYRGHQDSDVEIKILTTKKYCQDQNLQIETNIRLISFQNGASWSHSAVQTNASFDKVVKALSLKIAKCEVTKTQMSGTS